MHLKSKHHGTKPMHPYSLRAFQRDQECYLKHPGSVEFISTNKTKQTNYLCFLMLNTPTIFKPLTHLLPHHRTRPHLQSWALPSPLTEHPKHCQLFVTPFIVDCRTSQHCRLIVALSDCRTSQHCRLIVALSAIVCNKLLLWLYPPRDGLWNDGLF